MDQCTCKFKVDGGNIHTHTSTPYNTWIVRYALSTKPSPLRSWPGRPSQSPQRRCPGRAEGKSATSRNWHKQVGMHTTGPPTVGLTKISFVFMPITCESSPQTAKWMSRTKRVWVNIRGLVDISNRIETYNFNIKLQVVGHKLQATSCNLGADPSATALYAI